MENKLLNKPNNIVKSAMSWESKTLSESHTELMNSDKLRDDFLSKNHIIPAKYYCVLTPKINLAIALMSSSDVCRASYHACRTSSKDSIRCLDDRLMDYLEKTNQTREYILGECND